jgi:transcriptional regulator with XRE-family HTH domain
VTDVGPATPVVSLGGRLKRVRERSGRSLREVARQLGISASFLSQMERGKSQPSVATLYSLAQLLDVSIDELFAADEHDDKPLAEGIPGHGAPGPIQRVRGRSRPVSRAERAPADPWPGRRTAARLSVTRPGERHVLEMGSGVIWERLVDNTGAGLDFIQITYPPHSSSTDDKRMLQHSGREFGWLIEGELEITVGFELVTLHAGEAIGFDSAIPHLLANRTDQVARGIWCVRHRY